MDEAQLIAAAIEDASWIIFWGLVLCGVLS